jgi:hypothetical protein
LFAHSVYDGEDVCAIGEVAGVDVALAAEGFDFADGGEDGGVGGLADEEDYVCAGGSAGGWGYMSVDVAYWWGGVDIQGDRQSSPDAPCATRDKSGLPFEAEKGEEVVRGEIRSH